MARRLWLWLVGVAAGLALFVHSCVRFIPEQASLEPVPAAVETSGGLIVPVAGVQPEALADTFSQARSEGRVHDAIDIIAPRGTEVLAAAPGKVEKLFLSDRGGKTIYVRSPDQRWIYYYAHLDAYRPGIAEGELVAAGERLGSVGSTGNADPSAPHLHFAVHRMQPGESWYQGQPVNPYPLLRSRCQASG